MSNVLDVSDVQLRYARVLLAGKRLGLALLVVAFGVYLTGWRAPHVPMSDLPRYWGLPVAEYLRATGSPSGWGWIAMVGRGDFMNFAGIAFLSGITIVCYLAILPMLFRKRDTAYVVIAILEVMVLVLAASGILKGGGH